VRKVTFLLESTGKKMETKLYIGNMSHETTEQDLRTMFAEAGTVGSVDMILDRQTGKPKGFAFVTMSSQAEAEKAISMFNAKDVNSRTLKVNISQPREERTGPGGNSNKH
jgi:cold-inducible RNA-binding protein